MITSPCPSTVPKAGAWSLKIQELSECSLKDDEVLSIFYIVFVKLSVRIGVEHFFKGSKDITVRQTGGQTPPPRGRILDILNIILCVCVWNNLIIYIKVWAALSVE